MKYEQALQLWGARRIEDYKSSRHKAEVSIDPSTVNVSLDFDAGYACCGGTNPGCYCSYATSPTAQVEITGRAFDDQHHTAYIDASDFDFATVLGEILHAGGGVVHATAL